MSDLGERLAQEIRLGGPVDIATFMTLAMADRNAGYYSNRDPLGQTGDFITAPEISQMFGELIGAALAQSWIDLGSPARVILAEPGPGRGTLMADALRATRRLAGFHAAIDLHLMETSPVLRQTQRQRITHPRCSWHDDIDGIPDNAPVLLVANEFFDVLPIRQLVMTGDGLRERRIGVDDKGRLGFVLDPRRMPAGNRQPPAEGAILELSPAREAAMTGLAYMLARQGGTAFVIDYGALDLEGTDTLQAVQGHQCVDPLYTPGKSDLSSHVEFRPLLDIARDAGLSAFGPLGQGEWLERLGIDARLERLTTGADETTTKHLYSQRDRLVEAEQMGTLFKVIAVSSLAHPPAGFSHAEQWS